MRIRKKTNKKETKNNNIKPNKTTTVGVACYATQNNKQSHVGADALKSALKGVTLPALVITIIVMLILAGVTLNLTIGERGFFKSSQELQDTQTIAEYKEKIELSRGGAAVQNIGVVTLDNLTKQIYEDKVVPEGSIRKIDDEKAQMTTPEGYVFIITADGIEYIDKEDAIPVPPDLTEGNVEFKIDPETWTNKTVKISIEQKAGDKFTIEYSTDAKEWKKYTKKIETVKNTTIYARLKNPIGVAGNYASEKITNIDKLDPIKIVPTITATTNTITIDAGQASDAQATNEDGCSGIKQIWYSKDEGTTWQTNEKADEKTYTYKELEQNKTYKIQVKIIDNAINQTITKTQEITTGTVTIAEGNVTIENPTWDATAHTATVSITKGNSVASGLQIQYQVNSTSGTWTTGTSKSGLKLNDTVYARLWDGTNGGAYTSLKITENTAPTVTVNITGTSTNSITASASSVDNQSGMPASPTYTFYLKKTNEADTAYVEKHTGTETSFTFTNLAQTTGYTVKVETKDNAGNKGAGTKAGSTGTVTIAEGNVTIGNPTWNASTHKASVSITKETGVASTLSIQYQVVKPSASIVADKWTTGTSVTELSLNDTVYARLWDGTNGGAYTSLKITESTAPTITVNITGTSTNSITASASAVDNQSGMPASPTYTFFIKKTSEADSAYVQKQNNTNTTCSFIGLAQNTSYTVKVETKDNAGNIGTVIKEAITETVPDVIIRVEGPTWDANTHTASLKLIGIGEMQSGLSFQYQINSTTGAWTTWTIGTSKSGLKLNDTVYMRFWDGTNGGKYGSIKITESTAPTVTVNITGTSTNSITASASAIDNQSGMPASPTYTFFIKKTSEADSAYVQKYSGTNASYTFTGLAQTTDYTVKVTTKDNASNTGIGTKAGKTGTVTDGGGGIVIQGPTWDANTHTASITLSKGSTVPSALSIQYQVNSTTGSWTTGTSKSGLKLNDTVYMRFWDGTNGGNYRSLKITESTAPTITVNITGTSTNSITASASAVDNQSGMPSSPTYTFYLKKTNEADTTYVEKHTGTETSFTFTGLAQTTGYTVKVETKDNAGNKGAGTKAGTTGTVTIAEGNVTIGNPTWDATAHTAIVAMTKGTGVASGLQIQYQVNSTSGTWTTGTSKSGLKLNDTVYARLWDGTNGGAYTSLKITENIAPIVYVGTMLYKDPEFASGVNSTHVYNNKGNGTVTNTRKTMANVPNSSGYVLEIKTTGEADRGHGGFTFITPVASNKEFIARIVAKIPVGYVLGFETNQIGTGGTVEWFTSTKGTGNWEEYIFRVQCGSSGTFATTNYFCLYGGEVPTPEKPLIWQVAYATVIDASNITTSTNSVTVNVVSVDNQSGMPEKPIYTYYIKKKSEADSAYKQQYSGENTSYTFTNLAQITEYTIKVETRDKAGNVSKKDVTINRK